MVYKTFVPQVGSNVLVREFINSILVMIVGVGLTIYPIARFIVQKVRDAQQKNEKTVDNCMAF